MIVLAVALGGCVGAPARYLADRYVAARLHSTFPWGTFLVNLSGALLIGVLTGLTLHHHLAAFTSSLLATGFCGAYTTFSTWSFETVRLLEKGEYLRAGANAAGGLALGLGAVAAGLAAGLAA